MRTGWENLGYNNKFNINRLNVDFLYDNSILLTYPVGNWAYEEKSETKEFKLIEFVRENSVSNITWEDLIRNEHTWTPYLINDSFINDTIWNSLIASFLNSEKVSIFLRELINLKG